MLRSSVAPEVRILPWELGTDLGEPAVPALWPLSTCPCGLSVPTLMGSHFSAALVGSHDMRPCGLAVPGCIGLITGPYGLSWPTLFWALGAYPYGCPQCLPLSGIFHFPVRAIEACPIGYFCVVASMSLASSAYAAGNNLKKF